MTDRQQPHKQRCETCSNRKGHYDLPFCKFWDEKIPITKYGMDLIAHIGCASHSSATEPPTDYQCGDSCKGECSGEVTGIPHCPHSSAKEPAPLCECTHIPTQEQFIAEFVGNEQRKRDEHDTAIAQAERERVLDAVKEHCQKGIFNMNQCVVNDTRGNPIEELHTQRADERRETYKDIIRLSESLREGGGK